MKIANHLIKGEVIAMTEWKRVTLNQIGMMVEQLEDRIKLVAEGVTGNCEKLEKHEDKLANLEVRLNIVELKLRNLGR